MIIQILQMKKFILIINQDPGRCTLNIMIHITIHPIIFLTTHIPMILGMDIIGMLIGVKAGKIGKISERHATVSVPHRQRSPGDLIASTVLSTDPMTVYGINGVHTFINLYKLERLGYKTRPQSFLKICDKNEI
jgi:hypothetical protein